MAASRPGDYITAKCRRCNDVTGHVVMLVLEGAIAKVECKACGSVHKYRGDGAAAPAKKQNTALRLVKSGQSRDAAIELGKPASRTIGASTAKISTAAKNTQRKTESAWQEAMVRLNIHEPVIYSMKASFEPDTLIMHPTFGRGVVISVSKPDKMDVLFQEGVKILRCQLTEAN